jgi:ribosomal protein S27E
MIRVKCPKCGNAIFETAREGNDYLVTRITLIHKLGDQRRVKCRGCGVWIRIPRSVF